MSENIDSINEMVDIIDNLEKENESLKFQLQQAENKIRSKQNILDSLYANTERLWKWATETLTGEVADQFWQISANGFLMHENPEYHQQVNMLKHEVESLCAQLQQAEEREAAVKKAFEAWSDEPNWVCDEFDELCGAIEALSSPSQPPNRVVELEAQNVALREALEKALDQWAMYADAERDFDGSYLDKSEDPEDMEAIIYRQCKQALSSPSQPSRYQEMVDLLEKAAEEIENCYGRETELSQELRKALNALGQANGGGENGNE